MLNILLPSILPIAMPFSLFFAAIMLAAQSGIDVPRATIVRPTNDSEIFKIETASVEFLKTMSPPIYRSKTPEKKINNSFVVEVFVSISLSDILLLFLKSFLLRYK